MVCVVFYFFCVMSGPCVLEQYLLYPLALSALSFVCLPACVFVQVVLAYAIE